MWAECFRFKLHYGPANTPKCAERTVSKINTNQRNRISISHSNKFNFYSGIDSSSGSKTVAISKTFMVKCKYSKWARRRTKNKRQRRTTNFTWFEKICYKSNWFNCFFKAIWYSVLARSIECEYRWLVVVFSAYTFLLFKRRSNTHTITSLLVIFLSLSHSLFVSNHRKFIHTFTSKTFNWWIDSEAIK